MTATNVGESQASRDEAARARRGSLLVGALVVTLAGAYAATLVATEGEPLVVAPLIGAVVGLAVFCQPLLGLYLLFGAVMLFEQFEITGITPLTTQSHFYQNLSGFSGVPVRLSPYDLLAMLTCASWALRRLVGANEPARAGPLGWPVAAYGLAFVLGGIIGTTRGGSFDAIGALAEARAPLYACLLYFLVANLVHRRSQLLVLLWGFVLLVGVKALQGIGNYIEVANNGPYWIEAVTAHEEVVFFDIAIALMLVMTALRARGPMLYVLLALQPVIIAAELLTTRRVAFAALAAVLLVLALMAAVDRPRATMLVVAVGLLAFAGYAVAFWNHTGPLAMPMRVIREFVDPYSVSARDNGSNTWREIENGNIAFTIRQLPLTGVGLGQEYLFQREPPALTNFLYWRLMTHNALLWMWLKAGAFGAFALWFLVGQTLVVSLRLYRRLADPILRTAVSFPVLLTVALVVFSSVDLGLTATRTMTVLGVALGLAAPLSVWAVAERRLGRATELATSNDPERRRPVSSGSPGRVGGQLPTVTG